MAGHQYHRVICLQVILTMYRKQHISAGNFDDDDDEDDDDDDDDLVSAIYSNMQ